MQYGVVNCTESLMPKSPQAQPPDRLIPRMKALRENLLCSSSTDWRRRQADPSWPRPIRAGTQSRSRLFYRQSDLDNYLRSLPTESAAKALRLSDDERARIARAKAKARATRA
jgi:hypothetical protein